jgi:hypothetical protein
VSVLCPCDERLSTAELLVLSRLEVDLIPFPHLNRLVIVTCPQPELRSLQVSEDGDVKRQRSTETTDLIDGRPLLRLTPVREVEAEHVNTGVHELSHDVFSAAGRANGRNDLGGLGKNGRKRGQVVTSSGRRRRGTRSIRGHHGMG